jgi:recombination protein RecA
MALKPGEFLLYIVDSWDALTSERGKERFEKAAEKDNEEEASYGTEKAKYGSASFFSNICDISSGKDATLIIVSQIREKINAMFGKKHYRGGGKALDFYTHQVVWLAEIEKLSRVFRQEKRVYAIRSKAKFERNKVAKPFREAEFTILYDYGLDNISSMIDWYWGPKAQKIKFEDEDFSRAELIKYIEDEGLEDTLSDMCEKEWKEIENEISPKDRKKRFE